MTTCSLFELIFRSFWTWAGTAFLLAIAVNGVVGALAAIASVFQKKEST